MAPEAGHAVWRAWFALAFLCAALLTVALPQRASAQESAARAPSASDVRAEGDAWRAALPREGLARALRCALGRSVRCRSWAACRCWPRCCRSTYLYFATPLLNTMTRMMEPEADLYGLNLAREPDGEAEVLLKLVQYRKADPGALEEALFFTHPGTRRRIENAMRWKAQMLPAP